MRYVKFAIWSIFLILLINTLMPFSYVQAVEISQDNTNILACDLSSSSINQIDNDAERNNFDFASLLSLLGVGLLKFIDDKLKIKFKEKFSTYKNCLISVTIIFGLLETAIIVCYFEKVGPVSFGNLKNLFLGLIPIVFCLLTLITEKNESNPIVLSQGELDVRINDFTAAGMSPLGMIVGDMDFFGTVYNYSETKKQQKKKKDDITTNSQIQAIIDNNIDCIEIVCKYPTTNDAKRRIGYLINTFENRFHIRFFNQKIPIPQMRGRIMYKQNEQVVVITKKIRKPSKYEYSEYPASSLPGGLFADLWHTVWGCSIEDTKIIEQCKVAYLTFVAGKE